MQSNKSMRDEVPNNVEQNGIAIDFDAEGLKAYMFLLHWRTSKVMELGV